MNSFNNYVNSDNFELREACLTFVDLNFKGVAETHLKNNVVNLECFICFGINMSDIHVDALSCSGGETFFIKENISLDFNVTIVNKFLKVFYKFAYAIKIVKIFTVVYAIYHPHHPQDRKI